MVVIHSLDGLTWPLFVFLFSFSLYLYPDMSFLYSYEGKNLKGKQLAIPTLQTQPHVHMLNGT